MSTADVLSSPHEEITRCAQRREKLLRTLFGVTQIYLSIAEGSDHETSDTEQHGRELSAFLDSNDIYQNRFFNPSTLPSSQHTPLPDYSLRRQDDALESKQKHTPGQRSFTNHDRQPALQLSQTHEGDRRLEGSTAGGYVAESEVDGSRGCIDPLSFTPNDALTQEDEEIENLDRARKLGSSRAETSRSQESEESLASDAQAKTSVGRAKADVSPREGQRTHAQTSHLTPPDSGRSIYDNNDDQDASHGSKRQAISLERELRDATPATPEEELRFEDAQSLHRVPSPSDSGRAKAPSTTNSADLPSRFIQDPYDEGNSIMDIPPFGEDIAKHQRGTPSVDQDCFSQPPTSGMRNPIFAGTNGDAAKDPTFSRRPPMRIDTGVTSSAKGPTYAGEKVAIPASEVATPSKPAPLSSSAQSPPERMTTRVSSGALRHKSVSEILGETPKPTSPGDRAASDASRPDQAPSSAATPDTSAFRLRLGELKDKERSKLSTVVFAKPRSCSGPRSTAHSQTQQIEGEQKHAEPRDYFLTFFAAQVFQSPRAPPLSTLLRQAHKALGTSDHYIELREKQDFKVLNQIKEMQHHGRWSLRQPERSTEPQRSATHWDVLLGQMRWMRIDFREERKFKLAGAKFLAESCAAWVSASSEDRTRMQIKVAEHTAKKSLGSSPATPHLVHDEASEVTEDETSTVDPIASDPPAAIFSLPPDVFVFGLNKSPVSEKILHELPCYQPARDVQNAARCGSDYDADATWKTPIVPVSRYTRGKLMRIEEGPPRKRPRLDASAVKLTTRVQVTENGITLPPADGSVALFNPENKHFRDRIHAGHAFRPPSEYQMPSRDFFECRSPSQWTLSEDDELRRLVREYSYNWSLISNCLCSSTLYISGAERRTPWECFERWISLEGLPAEMSKVPYFRTYHQRLQQAARTYEARQQALIQQQGGNPAQLSLRRRSNQPYTVEKRKTNRPLHLVDAMRRHAKKKEAALHKQQQQATLGAMRKNNEVQKDRKVFPSAREMSRMKYEKQMKLEEQNRLLRMQYVASQHNAKKVVQQQANNQANGNLPNRNAATGVPNGNHPNPAAAVPELRGAGLDSNRVGPQMQRQMNGQANGVAPLPGQGVPSAPMQAQMQAPVNQRGPPQAANNDVRLFQEAQRVQAEQAYLQQRQQQRHSQQNSHASSPNMQNLNHLPQNNPAMLSSMQGRSSPSINGAQTTSGNGASPRINHSRPQSLSSGMTPAVNQIQNQIKLSNPSASPGEIQRLTTEQLLRMSQQHSLNQQAMAAAAGNSGSGLSVMQASNPILQHQQAMLVNSNPSVYNHQQYAAYMRAQQASQPRTGSAGNGVAPGMSVSRSVTPMVQRTGRAQGGPPRGPSQSPRPGPVGVAGAP